MPILKCCRLWLLVGFIGFGACCPAWAGHCAEPHFSSKKCRIAHSYTIADAIFMGQLLSSHKRKSPTGHQVHTSEFFVKESYKGGVAGQIKVFTEGGQTPPADIAGHYIVFVIKAGMGKFFFNPCSDYKFEKIESPLVDTPMQSQLRRIATTKDWTLEGENCVAEKTVIIKKHPGHKPHDHAVHDSRN